MYRKKITGFTLVELIVVIVILAILATIAFLSFSSQSASARDSTRLSDMSNISKGLSVFNATSGNYPKPTGNIPIISSGSTIGYQGYAGASILNMIKISNGGKDPLDTSTYYTYSTNAALNKFQILGFLEDGSNSALGFIPFPGNPANADPSSYSGRYVITKGNQLGIILDANTKVPIQANTSLTGVDIVNTTSQYVAYLDSKTPITGTGLSLKKIEIGFTNRPVDNSMINDILNGSLTAYYDMESLDSDGKLKDLSGNGYAATIVGGTSKAGKIGNARGFNLDNSSMSTDHILTPINNSGSSIFKDKFTVSAWVNTNLYDISHGTIVGQEDGFLLAIRSTGNMSNYISTVTGGWLSESNVIPIPLNQWTLMTLTYDGAMIRSYVNGTMVLTGTAKIGFMNSISPIVIGKRNTAIYQPFHGYIDEVRIYNRTLSDSEISSLYNATNK